jgi:hypothetical protein
MLNKLDCNSLYSVLSSTIANTLELKKALGARTI